MKDLTAKTMSSKHERWSLPILFTATLVIFSGLLVLCAWQADDAFVTWRTAENAASGFGLRWNVDERVQAYTSPLWMFLGLLFRCVTGEFYYTMLFVSMGITLASLYFVFSMTRPAPYLTLLIFWAFMCSNAFLDFSVSGLENPLLGFLVVGAAAAALHRNRCGMYLACGLIPLVRLDAMLLCFPVLFSFPSKNSKRCLLLSALPFVAWEVFSLVYYGTLVPNTAAAKLNHSVPKAEILLQGLRYVRHSFAADPITLVFILTACIFAWQSRLRHARLLVVGVASYMMYAIWIGGDFMTGRFFYAPFVQSAAAAASAVSPALAASRRRFAVLLPVLLLYFFLWSQNRVHTGYLSDNRAAIRQISASDGIVDERAIHYPFTGLFRVLENRQVLRSENLPTPPMYDAVQGIQFKNSSRAVTPHGRTGLFGFFAGPDKKIIDLWALSDPLLARVPFKPNGKWRIGHFKRPVPEGYILSRQTGRNHIVDPELKQAYQDILTVVSGPLFTADRLRAIWRLNTGFHNEAFEKAAQRQPAPVP